MTVVLLDPRRPTLLPVAAVGLLGSTLAFTADVPAAVLAALPGARPIDAAPDAAVLIASDPAHPAVTARLAAGAALIAADPLPGERLLDAVALMDRLRRTGAWEAAQTHESLRRFLLEETYELLDAVHGGDPDDLREELGDLLLQVLFHARIAEDRDHAAFGVDDVAAALLAKLANRVPELAGDATITAAEQVAHWEARKAAERKPATRTSIVDDLPSGLPALALAQKVLQRVSRAGLPADLIPAGLTAVSISADGDAENDLRAAVGRFAADVRAAEAVVRAESGVAGPISADRWRAAWPSVGR